MSEGKLTEYAVYLECQTVVPRNQPGQLKAGEITLDNGEEFTAEVLLDYDEDLATLFQVGQLYKVTITRAEDDE